MKHFIEAHFDKILLAAMVLYLIHVVIFLSVYVQSPETVSWARELTSGFAGGLLGLITGIAVGRKIEGDTNKREKEKAE